ncbi:hypothetical protein C2E23DRAFT_938487 [Lenzites betulinus]|nr:hypothetical protein C2E23DRAFT_938487 [Lenzites betulinus]
MSLSHLPGKEFLESADTQPPDTQYCQPDILYTAAALCADSTRLASHTGTADIVSSLLELSKMSARIACELNEEEDRVGDSGYLRAYKDLNRYVRGVDAQFDLALATSWSRAPLSPSPAPASSVPIDKTSNTAANVLEAMTVALLGGIPASASTSLKQDMLDKLDAKLCDSLHDRLLESLAAQLLPQLTDALLTPVARSVETRVSDRLIKGALSSLGTAAIAHLAKTAHSRRYSAPSMGESSTSSGDHPSTRPDPQSSGTTRSGAPPFRNPYAGDERATCLSGFKRTRFSSDEEDDDIVGDLGARHKRV